MAQATDSPTITPHGQANIFVQLAAPFPPERVSWRVGSTNADRTRGMALAYIDARDVMDRLTEVMGAHWQCRYVPMSNGSTCCEIGLLVEGDWLWRSNGAGNTDFEPDKGAYSDAFKRAAVLWGVGRYLYNLPSPWVNVEQRGRGLAIHKDEYAKLRQLLTGPPRRSAYAVRLGGDYPKVEKKLRAARTLRSLAAAWKAEQRTISMWPAGFMAKA